MFLFFISLLRRILKGEMFRIEKDFAPLLWCSLSFIRVKGLLAKLQIEKFLQSQYHHFCCISNLVRLWHLQSKLFLGWLGALTPEKNLLCDRERRKKINLRNLRKKKTGDINDPLGQSHNIASSEHCILCFVLLALKSTDGRTTCAKQWSLSAVNGGWPTGSKRSKGREANVSSKVITIEAKQVSKKLAIPEYDELG